MLVNGLQSRLIPRWLIVATLMLGGANRGDAQACTPQDADCDGISDRLEKSLLESFRP